MRRASSTRLAFRGTALIALLLPLLGVSSAIADDADRSFLIYAVNIHQTPMQSWGPGYGIYLGKGLFITAAHVAGHTWWTRPKVAINGQRIPNQRCERGEPRRHRLNVVVGEGRPPARASAAAANSTLRGGTDPWNGSGHRRA